ncbi:MAG: KAP family NTPase [bacterium]|nr:KAP family NTPase [bacterium]
MTEEEYQKSTIAFIFTEDRSFFGLGFAITPEYVIASGEGGSDSPGASLSVQFSHKTGGVLTEAKVVYTFHESRDGPLLFLLRLENPATAFAPLSSTSLFTERNFQCYRYVREPEIGETPLKAVLARQDKAAPSAGKEELRILKIQSKMHSVQSVIGSPVFSRLNDKIAGIVIGYNDSIRAAIVRPADTILPEIKRFIDEPAPEQNDFADAVVEAPYVHRPELEHQIIDHLLRADDSTTVLMGPKGAGKTALAQVVIRNRQIRKAYDRIYWWSFRDHEMATKGEVRGWLVRLHSKHDRQLPITESSEYFFDSLENLRKLLHGDKCLLVIDNFSGEGPYRLWSLECTKLITTHQAKFMAHTARYVLLQALTDDQAESLLSYGLVINKRGKALIQDLLSLAANYPLRLRALNHRIHELIRSQNLSSTQAIQKVLESARQNTPVAPEPESRESSSTESSVTLQSSFGSDHAATVDRLGRASLVRALASFLRSSSTRLPLAIGIDGPWGSGKSSLMEQLIHQLGADAEQPDPGKQTNQNLLKRIFSTILWQRSNAAQNDPVDEETNENADKKTRVFEPVRFNAWRYGTGLKLKANLVLHALHTITENMPVHKRELFWLERNLGRTDMMKLRRRLHMKVITGSAVGLLWLFALSAMLLGVWAVTWISSIYKPFLGLSSLYGMWGFYRYVLLRFLPAATKKAVTTDLSEYLKMPDYDELAGPDLALEQDFRKLASYLEREGRYLLMLVDDLDRCSPQEIVELVETINVFFSQEIDNCVFVVGMHREVVSTSLELAYLDLVQRLKERPGTADELPFGERFLDKILQFVVRIPEPLPQNLHSYVSHLTNARSLPVETQSAHTVESRQSIERSEMETVAVSAGEAPGISESDSGESSWTDAVENIKALLEEYDESSAEVQEVLHSITPYLRSNPRQIVRFLNALRFHCHWQIHAAKRRPGLAELMQFARSIAISLEWPALGALIQRDPDLFPALVEAAAKETLKEKLKQCFESRSESDSIIASLLSDGRLEELLKLEEPDSQTES